MAATTYMVIQFSDTLLRELQVGTVALKEGMLVGIVASKVVAANADPAATIVPAVGIVARSYQAHEKGCELFKEIRVGGVTGATVGAQMYLGLAGAMVYTKPALVGWLIQKVGTCYATKKVRVSVDIYNSVLIQGITIIVNNGVTTSVGMLLAISGGKAVIANAATGTALGAIGVADSIVVGDDALTVGLITNPNEIEFEWTVVAQTPGFVSYLDEAGTGLLTETAPDTAGDLIQVVAYQLSATIARACLEKGYHTIQAA